MIVKTNESHNTTCLCLEYSETRLITLSALEISAFPLKPGF